MNLNEIIDELNGISNYMEEKETTIGLGQINDLIEKLKQVKNCSIPDVIQRSEQLIDFYRWLRRTKYTPVNAELIVAEYLKSINCV